MFRTGVDVAFGLLCCRFRSSDRVGMRLGRRTWYRVWLGVARGRHGGSSLAIQGWAMFVEVKLTSASTAFRNLPICSYWIPPVGEALAALALAAALALIAHVVHILCTGTGHTAVARQSLAESTKSSAFAAALPALAADKAHMAGSPAAEAPPSRPCNEVGHEQVLPGGGDFPGGGSRGCLVCMICVCPGGLSMSEHVLLLPHCGFKGLELVVCCRKPPSP